MHVCSKTQDIDQLKIDVAVAKSDIATVKSEITGIKDKLDRFNWWFIGILISIIGGMGTILGAIIKYATVANLK